MDAQVVQNSRRAPGAGAFASAFDPTYELATAAPMSNVRLLLLRAAAVMATTTLLAGLAAFALPVLDWTAAAWLLVPLVRIEQIEEKARRAEAPVA